jgi:hypothetical protein
MTLSLVLLNGAIFTTVAAALVLFVATLFRKYPAQRATMLLSALAAVAIWPCFVILQSQFSWGRLSLPKSQDSGPAPNEDSPVIGQVEAMVPGITSTTQPASSPAPKSIPVVEGLALLWLTGWIVNLARLGRDHATARRVAKQSGELSPELRTRVGEILARYDLRYDVMQSSA